MEKVEIVTVEIVENFFNTKGEIVHTNSTIIFESEIENIDLAKKEYEKVNLPEIAMPVAEGDDYISTFSKQIMSYSAELEDGQDINSEEFRSELYGNPKSI